MSIRAGGLLVLAALAALAPSALAQSPTAIGGTHSSSGGLQSCSSGTVVGANAAGTGVNVTATCRTLTAATTMVFAAAQRNIYSIGVTNGSVAGYLLGYDAGCLSGTACTVPAPADGTVTPNACLSVPAGPGTWTFNWAPGPAWNVANGLVLVWSTGGSCFSQTSTGAGVFMWATGQ